jgi:hypothetical protein
MDLELTTIEMIIVFYQDNMPKFLFTSHSQKGRLQHTDGKA